MLLSPPCAFGRPSGTRTAWFAFCSQRPADVREGTSRRMHAHFPKCRHRPDPAAWSGDLCEEERIWFPWLQLLTLVVSSATIGAIAARLLH
jgi:hypothetical protein